MQVRYRAAPYSDVIGTTRGTQTPNLWFRRPVLYSVELG
jgi:hypothetical protein